MKCVICGKRPAREGAYCANCHNKIEAERRRRRQSTPERFITYRGHVVGLYRNGNGALEPRLLKRNPDLLPKKKTLNLNHYIEGFTREQVKRLKACILQLANA